MSTVPEHLEKLEKEYKCLDGDGHIMGLNREEWSSLMDIEMAIRKAKGIFNRTEKEKPDGN